MAAKSFLGLVTSKFPELEETEQVKARIEEAQQFIPLENLSISPQCGFASTEEGNRLTEKEQWRKVQLLQEIARSMVKNWDISLNGLCPSFFIVLF